MNKRNIIVILSVLALVIAVGVFAYNQYLKFYNSPKCNAGKPLEIAQYIFEVNQREFPYEQFKNAKTKIKNVKTIKQSGENYYCSCDLIVEMENGDTYDKKLYFISANYAGNPMVMLQNQTFTQKAELVKK